MNLKFKLAATVQLLQGYDRASDALEELIM